MFQLLFFAVYGASLAVNLDSPRFSASVAPFSIPEDTLGTKYGTDVILANTGMPDAACP